MKKTIEFIGNLLWALGITQFFRNITWNRYVDEIQRELDILHHQRDVVDEVLNAHYTSKQAKNLYLDLILDNMTKKVAPRG